MSDAAIPSYGIAEQDIDRLSQFLHSNAPELPDFDGDLPAVEVAIDMLAAAYLRGESTDDLFHLDAPPVALEPTPEPEPVPLSPLAERVRRIVAESGSPQAAAASDMLMREFGVTVPMCFAIETEAQLVAYLQRSPDQDGEGA